jgi:hypothetical protein
MAKNAVASFVEAMLPQAQAAEAETGIPAHILLGQAGLETGWGRSLPKNSDGTSSNNLFGIKAGGNWQGKSARTATNEEVGGRMVRIQDDFRAYDTPAQSMSDWARLLNDSRYARALEAAKKGDPKEFGVQIYKAGYATDSRYPEKVSSAALAVQREMKGGKDLSAELYGTSNQSEPKDLSAELYGKKPVQSAQPVQQRHGAFMRGVQGIAQGIADPINALGQMFTQAGAAVGLPGAANKAAEFNKYVSQQDAQYKRDVRGGQDDFDFGRMTGNVVGTLPLTVAAPVGASMASAAGLGAGAGLLSGALQPVTQGDFWDEKRKQVMTGAAGGAAFGAGGRVLAGVISPTVNPKVAMLRREGVTPTIGQIMGDGFKSAEEKLTSLPFVGSAIKSGQQRAVGELNEAAFNRALAPIGQKLPTGQIGNDAVLFTRQKLNSAYDDALNAVGPIAIDRPLSVELNNLRAGLAVLPKDKDEQFFRILQAEIFNRAQNGRLTPEAMKAAEQNLGDLSVGYRAAQDFDVQKLGDAIEAAQDALRQAVARQAPPGAANMVRSANAGWANFKRVQRAASYVGTDDGVFSPAQLQRAVQAADRSKDKARFAEGTALMQDLSSAGRSVVGTRTPNSGTADRLNASNFLNPMMWAQVAAAIPGSLMYTPTGQRLAASALTGRQGAGYGLLSDAGRRLAVPGGVALSPALQGLLNQ